MIWPRDRLISTMRIFSVGAYVIVFERKASNQDDDGAPSEGRREVLDIGASNAIYCFWMMRAVVKVESKVP